MAPEWTLGDRLRRARRSAGLQRKDVADALGVSLSTVQSWENDTNRPKDLLETARELEELTGVDAGWLLGVRTGSRCFDETDIPDVSWEAAARAHHPTSHDVPATCQSDVA